jgi:hypothetical protein
MKQECQTIEMELKAKAAAARAMEQMRQAEDAEKAEKPGTN